MRWFHIRKAEIDLELRETFEQHGVATMQAILATTNYFQHKGHSLMAQNVLPDLLPWLTEQYDRAERKETWFPDDGGCDHSLCCCRSAACNFQASLRFTGRRSRMKRMMLQSRTYWYTLIILALSSTASHGKGPIEDAIRRQSEPTGSDHCEGAHGGRKGDASHRQALQA